MKVTIISIGDELLIGQTINTNAAWMGQKLNEASIKVYETISISDTAEHIKSSVHKALQQSDAVLITGGLGATKDDITKKALADYFGSKMVFHQDIWDELKAYLKKRGRLQVAESLKTIAMIPDNCDLIRNLRGTAAAMWFAHGKKIVVAMPGVPHEMKDFMARSVIPRLQKEFETPKIIHENLMCCGIAENVVSQRIEHIEDNLPSYIKIAYLPNMGILRVRISATGNNAEKLAMEVAEVKKQIAAIIGTKYVFGTKQDTIEEIIGNLLIAQNKKMAIAESCTGGRVAHQMTLVGGCSRYFEGSLVAYSNDIKQSFLGVKTATLSQYGAVSQQTVEEMALGTIQKFDVDYALAITGIAGPSGGTAEKPVGTVWIAVANRSKVYARLFTFARTRDLNILLTSNVALNLLRRLILGMEV
ncbi:MAG: CinA family nicotinamide mononucleotide deamidase-related protein [Chitinophagales bacterium]